MSAKPETDRTLPQGAMRTAISDSLVSIHREQFGRGPERTQTVIGGDIVTVVLEGVLTRSEESLIGGGDANTVESSRVLLQRTAADASVATIERITGRKVCQVISGMNSANGGTAVEVFILDGPVAQVERD